MDITLDECWLKGGNMALLALFLRYVVACRMNDHRPMPFLDPRLVEGNIFVGLMNDKLGKARDPNKSIPQMQYEVRGILCDTSLLWYSTMLRNIEKPAYRLEVQSYEYLIMSHPSAEQIYCETAQIMSTLLILISLKISLEAIYFLQWVRNLAVLHTTARRGVDIVLVSRWIAYLNQIIDNTTD